MSRSHPGVLGGQGTPHHHPRATSPPPWGTLGCCSPAPHTPGTPNPAAALGPAWRPCGGGGCGTPMPRMGSGRAGSGHYGGVSWAEQPPAGRAAPSPAPAPAGEGVSTLATPSPFLFPSERKEWGRGQWMTDRDGHPGCSRPAHSCPVCHQKAPGRCAGDPLPGQGSGRPPSPDR